MAEQATYTAWQYIHKGGPEVIQAVEKPWPQRIRMDHVWIRVEFTGVSQADIWMRKDLYPGQPAFPLVPGYDVVGHIVEKGVGVDYYPIGQRVLALCQTGGYAEYVEVHKDFLVPVPDDLPGPALVALCLNYTAAYQMLTRCAELRSGDTILVAGAGGGMGMAFLQIGQLAGLRMIGLASAAKHELVQSLGALTVDYHQSDWVAQVRRLAPDGVAAAFDLVGGWQAAQTARLLAPKGTLVCYGFQGASSFVQVGLRYALTQAILALLRMRGYRAEFYSVYSRAQEQGAEFKLDLARLVEFVQTGLLVPLIDRVVPLHQCAQAQIWLEEGRISGKMVLAHSPLD